MGAPGSRPHFPKARSLLSSGKRSSSYGYRRSGRQANSDIHGTGMFAAPGGAAIRRRDRAQKILEDEVKEWISASSEVELTGPPDWKNSSGSMIAIFSLRCPVGRRRPAAARSCRSVCFVPRKSIYSSIPTVCIQSLPVPLCASGRSNDRTPTGLADREHTSNTNK